MLKGKIDLGLFKRQTKRRLGLASLLGVAAWCSATFWFGTMQSRGLSSEVYAQQRLPLVNAKLSEAEKGFIFLAGDSHAEHVNATYRLCGREMVNGGISGAKAELYKEFAERLKFTTAPEIVVLTIGTNNLLRKVDPLSRASMKAFEESVARTLASFQRVAPRVVVTALPPIGSELKGAFEIEAVSAYSNTLHSLCARRGCEFVDPYDTLREADGSTARAGAMRDGLHLKSYRTIYARLGKVLCPGSLA